METFENAVDPTLVRKLWGCFSVNRPKLRLLKTMVWLPTFKLRILDDHVNNKIMLIVVPIDMYG